jgi:hypothetical protein
VTPAVRATVVQRLRAGLPVLLMGQADAMDAELRRELDVAIESTAVTSTRIVTATVAPNLIDALGTEAVLVHQRRRSLAQASAWQPVLTSLQGPICARHATLPCWIWETPVWPGGWEITTATVPSMQLFELIGQQVGDGWHLPRWRNERHERPCHLMWWRYADGATAILLGNLENGLCGDSAHAVIGHLDDRRVWTATHGAEHLRLTDDQQQTRILLAGHQRGIIESR